MSSESSSDGTYSSESESVSSASDISSEFATDSEPEATASDSDSDSNPFGDLEESDSSTDDEDTEAPLEAVDPDFISATVDGMSAEDRAVSTATPRPGRNGSSPTRYARAGRRATARR